MQEPKRQTSTSSFGVGRREGHDASAFYRRFSPPELSDDETVDRPDELLAELGPGRSYLGSIEQVGALPENSVALVVTSPPYFVGKEYELAVTAGSTADSGDGEVDGDAGGAGGIPATYLEYLELLRTVFAECQRVLEPGGRIAVNVANLGRKPYRSLSADVAGILQDDLGLLLRGEIIWEKAGGASGSCAWGSFGRASNPVLRDVTERVIVACKGRFARARTAAQRRKEGLPHRSTLTNDEFVDATLDVWRIESESATRVGHPAPFPVDLPRRLIELYTYEGDLVVDPFAGSGTTLVAAARTGRIGVGFDTDPSYAELADRRLAEELTGLAEAAAEDDLGRLDPGHRQERFHAAAIDEARKLDDIAHRVLAEAGFAEVEARPRRVARVVDPAFRIVAQGGRSWLVETAGPFLTTRPGLQRIDAVWRLLGRLHVVAAAGAGTGAGSRSGSRSGSGAEGPPGPVLVLTSNRPRAGSPADRALHAVGPEALFDVIELYDPASLDRLARYADGSAVDPLPGFWTERELATAAAVRQLTTF